MLWVEINAQTVRLCSSKCSDVVQWKLKTKLDHSFSSHLTLWPRKQTTNCSQSRPEVLASPKLELKAVCLCLCCKLLGSTDQTCEHMPLVWDPSRAAAARDYTGLHVSFAHVCAANARKPDGLTRQWGHKGSTDLRWHCTLGHCMLMYLACSKTSSWVTICKTSYTNPHETTSESLGLRRINGQCAWIIAASCAHLYSTTGLLAGDQTWQDQDVTVPQHT